MIVKFRINGSFYKYRISGNRLIQEEIFQDIDF